MAMPYFPFYPGDWLRDCALLTLEEEGAYIRLLAYCWQTAEAECSLPDDDTFLARVLKVPPATWKRLRKTLVDNPNHLYWHAEGGRLVQKRLVMEWDKACAKTAVRRAASRNRWPEPDEQPPSKRNAIGYANGSPIGDANAYANGVQREDANASRLSREIYKDLPKEGEEEAVGISKSGGGGSIPSADPPPPPVGNKTEIYCPPEFTPTVQDRGWAAKHCKGIDVDEQWARFLSYPKHPADVEDWHNRFRNWLTQEVKYRKEHGGASPEPERVVYPYEVVDGIPERRQRTPAEIQEEREQIASLRKGLETRGYIETPAQRASRDSRPAADGLDGAALEDRKRAMREQARQLGVAA